MKPRLCQLGIQGASLPLLSTSPSLSGTCLSSLVDEQACVNSTHPSFGGSGCPLPLRHLASPDFTWLGLGVRGCLLGPQGSQILVAFISSPCLSFSKSPRPQLPGPSEGMGGVTPRAGFQGSRPPRGPLGPQVLFLQKVRKGCP